MMRPLGINKQHLIIEKIYTSYLQNCISFEFHAWRGNAPFHIPNNNKSLHIRNQIIKQRFLLRSNITVHSGSEKQKQTCISSQPRLIERFLFLQGIQELIFNVVIKINILKYFALKDMFFMLRTKKNNYDNDKETNMKY